MVPAGSHKPNYAGSIPASAIKKIERNAMSKVKRTYIECECSDLSHLTRMTYDPDEKVFWLEVNYNKYPFPMLSVPKWLHRIPTVCLSAFTIDIWIKYSIIKYRLLIIKHAIFGKPIWYKSESIFSPNEAKKLANFIMKLTKRKDLTT